MSELRKLMNDQMLLKGFSEKTKQSYLSAVSLLARYYHLPPDKLSHNDIQNWFLYLIKERKLSPATCRQYLYGLRFFYLHVLCWSSLQVEFTVPKKTQKIPDLLSSKDVRLIIAHARYPKYRMIFIVSYTCGLRLSELVALKVKHIHSDEHYLQVVQAKGFKDRNIPLPLSTLKALREYWLLYHPDQFLFAGRDLGKPLSPTSVQKHYTQTKLRAGIKKKGGIHALRHAFASHQLAAGMPIHQLKNILGHTDIKSTERYLHWRPEANDNNESIDLLCPARGGKTDE